jgi:gamma-glutamylcyclotransferase (GGCT)/AIG2-like uncharacterized protein YtfP
MPYLFVYGTLRSTFDNRWARLLRREADFVGRGRVRGRVSRVGRYTALVPTGIRNIDGEVYRLKAAARTLAILDRYEGSGYERVIVRVRHPAGVRCSLGCMSVLAAQTGMRKNRLRQIRQR